MAFKSKLCDVEECKVRVKADVKTCRYHSVVKCLICDKPIKFKSRSTNHVRIKVHDGACRAEQRKKYDRIYNRKKCIKTGESEAEIGGGYFGNAKEPLMPAPKGSYGYMGVIRWNKNKDKIQCHVCGLYFRALSGSGHLKVHNLNNAQYKKKYGLARTLALVAEGTRVKHLQAILNRSDYTKLQEHLKAYSESDKANEQRRKNMLGKKRRISTRNKSGHCPAQLLDHIQKLADKLGKAPNSEDFKREYKGKYMSTILLIYGSYEEAVKLAGLDPRTNGAYTQVELIEFMRNFYKRFKRTPANTDFKRGYLPTTRVYIDNFGSLNRARAIAGVPLMIKTRGGWSGWEEIPLTEKLRDQVVNNL